MTPITRRTLEIAAFCAALLLVALIFHSWLAAHDDQLRLQSTLASQKQAIDAADARERDRATTLRDALSQIDALKRAAQHQTPAELARALQDALHLPQPIAITQDNAVGAPHGLPAAAGNPDYPENRRPCSNSSHGEEPGCLPSTSPPDTRAFNASPAPPSITIEDRQSPGAHKNESSQQGTAPHAKSLFDTIFHRNVPRTTPPSPPQQPGVPYASHGDASASPPLPDSTTAASPAAQQSSATNPATSASAVIPTADLPPLYDYVQDCRACQLRLAAAQQNATDDAAKIAALTRERDAALTAAKGGSFWLRLKRNAHWLAIGAAVGSVASSTALCSSGHCRR